MDVQYSPETRQAATEWTLLEQASTRLDTIIRSPSSQFVKVQWNRVPTRPGGPLYRLTIWDSVDEVFTDFALDELQNPLHMQVRLSRLWGDLLEIRNDRQHEQVRILSNQITTDPEGD